MVSALDQTLACREVLAFPARLLAGLPLPTTLVLERIVARVRAQPARQSIAAATAQWTALVDAAPPGASVGQVLLQHGVILRAVELNEGSP